MTAPLSQTWVNGSGLSLSATNLQAIVTSVNAGISAADTAQAAAVAAQSTATTANGTANTAATNATAALAAQTAATAVTLNAAVTTSGTTETVVLSLLIPANQSSVGSTYRVTLFGVTTGSGNLTGKIHIGAAGTIADTLAATIGPYAAIGAIAGRFDFLVTLRTIGASGSVIVAGMGMVVGLPSQGTTPAPAAVAVDTTGARYITLTTTMSALAFTAHTAAIDVVHA